MSAATNVSNFVKKLIDPRVKKFLKAGFLDSELHPTKAYEEAVKTIFNDKFGAELEALADEIIAEEEAKK